MLVSINEILEIRTELQRTSDQGVVDRSQSPMYWKTHSQGTLVAVFDPLLESKSIHWNTCEAAETGRFVEQSGIYLEDCQVVNCAAFAGDTEIAGKLWEFNE